MDVTHERKNPHQAHSGRAGTSVCAECGSDAIDRLYGTVLEHGYRILEKIPFLSLAGKVVLCHEERYDGSGYPFSLKGEKIPLPARLFAVIDTLDAMTFDRPYRKALPFDAAKTEIIRMSGSQFDPLAVEAFLETEAMLREMTSLESQEIKNIRQLGA